MTTVLLRELVFEDFGVYRGRQTIDLCPPTPDRPIVLFGGLNGAGKTTLLKGLNLVLYGKRAVGVGRTRADYDFYLREAIYRGAAETKGAALELLFDATHDGVPAEFRVRRYWNVGSDGRVLDHLAVFHNGDKSAFLTDHWDEVVEEILPLEISSLFFFDGEKIEALADPEKASHVTKTAIESLLGLSLLDRLSVDLVALERRKRAASVDEETSRGLVDLERDADSGRMVLKAAVQDQASCQNDIDAAERVLEAARGEFRRAGGDAFEQRTVSEQRREAAQVRINELQEQLVEVAAGSLPLRLLDGLFGRTIEQARLEQEAAEAHLLADVLTERDRMVMEEISGHLSASVADRIASALGEDRAERSARSNLPCLLDVPEEFGHRASFLRPSGLERLADQALNLVTQLEEAERELEEADRQLAAVPSVEAVATAIDRCESAVAELAEAQGRHHVRSEAVEIAESKLRTIEQQLERRYEAASERVIEGEDAERVIRHAERARTTIAQYRSALLERHLGRIEAAVFASLGDLLHKESLIGDLNIDPESFELKLFDHRGKPLASSLLSAGERQVLALSLLWGLARVSGRGLPTVIDTPLGRLDSSHRQLLVERYFPNAGRQVLLLSTDEEIDEGLLRVLSPSIGVSYRLQHNDDGDWTLAVPGYFWEAESNVA